MSLHIVILAAGKGKRMLSKTPKVLHELAGKPMLLHVLETAQKLKPDTIHLVHGQEIMPIKNTFSPFGINWVFQAEPLGTGHALSQALPHIPLNAQVLVLSADVPLIQTATLQNLINIQQNTTQPGINLLVAQLNNPSGLGRVLRGEEGKICAVVEEKDASLSQKQIQEVYSGICCAYAKDLARWLPSIRSTNAQKEYYLTDIITLAVAENYLVSSLIAPNNFEIHGVNDRLQLQQLERAWQQYQATQLLLQGTSIADINRIDIRGEVTCGKDVFIDINTIFQGKVSIGENTIIGPNCVLKNVVLGNNCEILANSVLTNCEISNNCKIGPYAHLRPGTIVNDSCKIGNFVEVKNTTLGNNTKANHLSYLGDAIIGEQTNIGAGTITCNYDGANKHKTIIEEGVFIGSGTQLVAPLIVGANATIGAGSTIRKNVPGNALTLTDNKQKTIVNWTRAKKVNDEI